MSNLCGVSGRSIQFVNNTRDGKGRKDGTESLWELTAGAKKYLVCLAAHVHLLDFWPSHYLFTP